MRRKILPCLAATFSLLVTAHRFAQAAQEVGYLDMTSAVVGHRIHQPTSGSAGGMGAGYGDGAVQDRAHQSLRITLVSLGSEKYRVGEDLVYEIKVENTGQEPLLIPWDPNLADMEPAPPTTAYEYRRANIELWLSDASNETEVSQFNSSLYGTSKNPRSFVRVGPGEWVRVRASARLSPTDGAPSFERSILVRVAWTTSKARVTPSKDGYREDSEAEGPLNISVNTAHFELLGPAQRP